MKNYYVYNLASKRNGTLYIGVTNNLIRRVYEHKNDLTAGFTKKYGVNQLVYYEQCDEIVHAIQREKQLKSGTLKFLKNSIKKKLQKAPLLNLSQKKLLSVSGRLS